MNQLQTVLEYEAAWRSLIRRPRDRTLSVPVLAISGPSGVGKTTVVSALAKSYPTFIETTRGNPHLEALLKGEQDFNASANQEWFLQRAGEHIARADPGSPLVIDQDPAAIVLAYARMFHEDGKMSLLQYFALLEHLLNIEETLHAWKSPRTVLFLDAPPDVLYRRVLKRSGETGTPPPTWFDRVRSYFVELFACFPNAITISTINNSPDQIVSRVKELIEARATDSQL